MAEDKPNLRSLFGSAKKWAQEELKNAKRVTGTPQEHHSVEEANEGRLRDLEREVEQVVATAAVESMFPDVKRLADRAAQKHDAANADRDQRARAVRESNSGRASVTVSGAIFGHVTLT
jgi:hypothetical protein